MSPKLQKWKSHVQYLPHNRAAFEKWLFVHIACVLFGNKSGELLMLMAGECRMAISRQLRIIAARAPAWNCSFKVLLQDKSCARIVFYNHARVQEALEMVPAWALHTIGYPEKVAPETFLAEVGQRWQATEQIPHEIGFALGYPAKDVLGYMGLISSPCTGMCGWRIHGDPQPSLRKSMEFKQAQQRARSFLSM